MLRHLRSKESTLTPAHWKTYNFPRTVAAASKWGGDGCLYMAVYWWAERLPLGRTVGKERLVNVRRTMCSIPHLLPCDLVSLSSFHFHVHIYELILPNKLHLLNSEVCVFTALTFPCPSTITDILSMFKTWMLNKWMLEWMKWEACHGWPLCWPHRQLDLMKCSLCNIILSVSDSGCFIQVEFLKCANGWGVEAEDLPTIMYV